MLVIGGLVLLISFKMFYTKTQIDESIYTKKNVDNLLKNASCRYLDVDVKYFGQTPAAICQSLNKKPQLLLVKEVVSVQSESNMIYQDENYIVDNTLFNVPLGKAEDFDRTYGNPISKNMGNINRFTQGFLCC